MCLQRVLVGPPADLIVEVIMALEGTLQMKEVRDFFVFLLETLLHIYNQTWFLLRRARYILFLSPS